jgi:TRAP-type C4-dicarboxylate transport system permease small subunit
MARFYAILAIAGWAWTLLVLIFVAWRLTRRQSGRTADQNQSKPHESKAIP